MYVCNNFDFVVKVEQEVGEHNSMKHPIREERKLSFFPQLFTTQGKSYRDGIKKGVLLKIAHHDTRKR